MATIEQTIEQMLVERGLFENDAKAIMTMVKADASNDEMRRRWSDSMAEYPPNFINVLWIGVRRIALEWIEANCPKHWARELFTEEQSQ